MKHIPNFLSLSRIFLAVLLLFVALHYDMILPDYVDKSWVNYLTCLIFCIASFTDFFDGYIARRYNFHSRFGEVF
ncbi:CDP-alcohol phosphatidyltransferase family protein, partial [Helicobacter typhlonius]